MSEDAAPYFTNRGFLTWKIQDAMMRMQATPDPELKKHWARVMVAAKRERGDFDDVVQPPVSDELVDAIAKHEAQASVQNLEGERHD